MLQQKGVYTIRSLSQGNKVIIFTGGSSDNFFNRSGAGILLIHPSGIKTKLKISTDRIASNFTCELIAI